MSNYCQTESPIFMRLKYVSQNMRACVYIVIYIFGYTSSEKYMHSYQTHTHTRKWQSTCLCVYMRVNGHTLFAADFFSSNRVWQDLFEPSRMENIHTCVSCFLIKKLLAFPWRVRIKTTIKITHKSHKGKCAWHIFKNADVSLMSNKKRWLMFVYHKNETKLLRTTKLPHNLIAKEARLWEIKSNIT